MTVGVVIPSLYEVDAPYLKLCVQSLKKTTDWPIAVVTNGEVYPNGLGEELGVMHTHNATQGQCAATNTGAADLGTDYIMVSNSDMYYAPGWNRNLRFDHECFSPNLIEPNNNAGSAPPFLKFDGGLTLEEFSNRNVDIFVDSATNEDPEKDREEETGFNLPFFIRRDIWETIGGYDEAYDPWGSNSDTDLQTKIELAGIQPMRLRDVLVYHFSNKSGTFDGTHQEEWQKNWDYYRDKWGFTRDDNPDTDTWMAKNMVIRDKNVFHPEWEMRYAIK